MEIADTSDNWIIPEVDWLYKNISTIETVGDVFHPEDYNLGSQALINIENNPVMYYDFGGPDPGNYPPDQMERHYDGKGDTSPFQIFETTPGKTISLEIQDFQIENNYDFFKIEG